MLSRVTEKWPGRRRRSAAMKWLLSVQFSRSVMFNSATAWTAARQASLSITNSQSLLKLMSIDSVMPSNHDYFKMEEVTGYLQDDWNDPIERESWWYRRERRELLEYTLLEYTLLKYMRRWEPVHRGGAGLTCASNMLKQWMTKQVGTYFHFYS